MTEPVSLDALKARLRERLEAEGTQFCKCANCGDVYPLGTPTDEPGEYWTDTTVCGPRCFAAYVAYLNDPDS